MKKNKKIVRVTTVTRSLRVLLGNQIDFIKDYYDIILVSNDENGDLQELSTNKNLPYYHVELTRKITPIKDLKALIQLIKILKKEKPEIVHTHTPKAGLIGMIAAKVAGVKHRLHTVAGMPLLEAKGLKYKILVVLEKVTYICSTKVYFNSKTLMKIVNDKKIYKINNKFKVIGNGSTNGVDINKFDKNHYTNSYIETLKNSEKINPSDVVFLFVGRIVKDKGVNELILAFKKLNAKYENIKLIMLGRYENDLNPILKTTEEEINTNKNILFLGYKKDVRPYFAISDIFVFPSYREGFPNVVMQAGAMSLPSIVTDINGSNEIIKDGYNGQIIPVKNAEALYEAMKDWYLKSDNLSNYKTQSREYIKTNFDQEFVSNKVLEEYNNLD